MFLIPIGEYGVQKHLGLETPDDSRPSFHCAYLSIPHTPPPIKFTHLKCTAWWFSNIFTELCNPPHKLSLEQFHRLPEKLYCRQSLLTLCRALGNHQSVIHLYRHETLNTLQSSHI